MDFTLITRGKILYYACSLYLLASRPFDQTTERVSIQRVSGTG